MKNVKWKITPNFEASDDTDVIDWVYLDKKLNKPECHIPKIGKMMMNSISIMLNNL